MAVRLADEGSALLLGEHANSRKPWQGGRAGEGDGVKFLDPQHPFFKPLWRRILTVVAPAAWGLVELSNGASGWAILFFGASAYAAYELLFMFERSNREAASTVDKDRSPADDNGADGGDGGD